MTFLTVLLWLLAGGLVAFIALGAAESAHVERAFRWLRIAAAVLLMEVIRR